MTPETSQKREQQQQTTVKEDKKKNDQSELIQYNTLLYSKYVITK